MLNQEITNIRKIVAKEEDTLENLENVFSSWADEIDLKQKEIKNDIKKYKRQLSLQF